MLQNENQTLPLSNGAKVAVVGPMAFARSDMISDYGNGKWRRQNACWNAAHPTKQGGDECIPTIAEAIAAANAGGSTMQAAGVDIESDSTTGIAAALALVKDSDVVVLTLGIVMTRSAKGLTGKTRPCLASKVTSPSRSLHLASPLWLFSSMVVLWRLTTS